MQEEVKESRKDQTAVEFKCGILHSCPCDRGCCKEDQCIVREFPADHRFASYLIQRMLKPRRMKRAVKR